VYVLDIHNIGFGVGVLCAWLVTNNLRLSKNACVVALLIGCLGVFSLMGFEWLANDNFAGRQTVSEEIGLSGLYTTSFAFIILGSVSLELSVGLKISRHLALFGASSYMLYLIHDPLESLLMKIISTQHVKPYFNENTAFAFAVVVAVATAIYLHMKLEVPVTKFLGQKWLDMGKLANSRTKVILRRRI
jgi:exopolysaccharide production protein ExoZ